MSFIDQLSRFRSLRNPRRFAWVALALSPLIAGAIWARSTVRERGAVAAVDDRADDLKSAIAKAKPGDTIVLAAGTYLAPIELPAGVGVKGAGRHATIIDARAQAIGISTEGGSNAEIADLTVMGAKQTNIKVSSTKGTKIRGVRSVGSINGISFTNVENGRIENTIADENRYGIVVGGGENVVVVNCTLARNGSIGLSLPVGERPIAFNNVVVESSTCLYLGDKVVDPKIDYNLYFGQTIGKLSGQTAKNSLNEWRYVSGQDFHSVSYSVEFRDRKIGDFRPASRLSWSLERATTSDWGVAEFAGSKAPAADVDGSPRVGAVDAGAFEVTFKPSREPDGKFEIENDQGWKSAGLFDRNDRLVFYLFHELPLAKGKYSFWAPGTTDWGRPIAAGDYELRIVEAELGWRYMGYIGDDGEPYPQSRTASVAPGLVAFDQAGHLLMAQGWSEDGTNLRAYSALDGKLDWFFEGSSETRGLAVAGDGVVYIARNLEKTIKISRLDPKRGSAAAGEGFPRGEFEAKLDPKFEGIAELDGRLYIADRAHNEVKATDVGGSEFVETFVVDAPSHPAADRVNHLIWLIGGDKKVIAINGQGRVLVEASPVEFPAALAFHDGKLAIASRKTGKVHVFDATTPTELKPTRTLGRGDGPFGPYLPDRFTFQAKSRFPGSHLDIALGPNGKIAVVDGNRLLVFDDNNKLVWSTYGVFGNAMTPSFVDPKRIYDAQGSRSLVLDFEKGAWRPEAFLSTGLKNEEFLGEYEFNGKRYGVFLLGAPGRERSLVTGRFDDRGFHPVSVLTKEKNQCAIIADKNQDGLLDEHDSPRMVAGLRPGVGWFGRFNVLYPNGDILAIGAGGWFAHWKPSFDSRGIPVYLPEKVDSLKRDPKGIVSPYTHEHDPQASPYCVVPALGGGYVANVNYKTSPGGTGLSNTAGTDLAGVDSRGDVRWVHPYSEKKGIVGLARLGPVMITGVTETSEIVAVDRDGLGLNGFTLPAKLHYSGYFLDHTEAVRSLRGTDGRLYALIADNYNGRIHWWRLEGEDRIKSRKTKFVVSSEVARLAAVGRRRAGSAIVEPSATVVRVSRLDSPLAIDGDLDKWRKAGIVPQIIMTPETSSGGISGPRDASAVIRLAYHEKSLYVQILQFDDVVSFHQPVAFHYKQDCVEMCINGFMTGFKFDVTQTTDAGPMIVRQRFGANALEKILPKNHVPLSIKALPDAKEVVERELIENVFGENMADCKVIATEFRLPIDEITYQGDPKAIFPLRSGQTFWIGFMIDDNDNPGTDVQNLMVWPSTYGTFKAVESGARAVLD